MVSACTQAIGIAKMLFLLILFERALRSAPQFALRGHSSGGVPDFPAGLGVRRTYFVTKKDLTGQALVS